MSVLHISYLLMIYEHLCFCIVLGSKSHSQPSYNFNPIIFGNCFWWYLLKNAFDLTLKIDVAVKATHKNISVCCHKIMQTINLRNSIPHIKPIIILDKGQMINLAMQIAKQKSIRFLQGFWEWKFKSSYESFLLRLHKWLTSQFWKMPSI